MTEPILFLTVGLPGMGKTTAARRLEVEHSALRLNKDEWMKALYGRENPGPASDVIEGRLIQIGLRALQLGVNVVIDFGLWSKDERSALRQAAKDVGACSVVCFFDLPREEQRKRLDRRLADAPQDTWPISTEELDRWERQFDAPTPGEIDGSEPIHDPPARFRSWQDWISDRWPPAVAQLFATTFARCSNEDRLRRGMGGRVRSASRVPYHPRGPMAS